jgi:hypothetical protein
VKYDGYRLRVERDGDRVRLITRGGYDWTKCYPWIAEAALKNRQKRFVIDGEAVILGVDGISDFDALFSGKHNDKCSYMPSISLRSTVMTCASFHCPCERLTFNGCWHGRPDGIFIAPFEQGEIGPDLFSAACRMGLEGLVSKRRGYRCQPSQNKRPRLHLPGPVIHRGMSAFWSRSGSGGQPCQKRKPQPVLVSGWGSSRWLLCRSPEQRNAGVSVRCHSGVLPGVEGGMFGVVFF